MVATIRQKISSDGNELTTTTASKGHADQITVWTRSGGAKAAKDLFAGEWTQDLSKSHMRQGSVLKIESAGTSGVRFTGEFSYTARFDGKQYDLKNSRNDTVTLELVDSHTVDAIYRRGDQVAQKDRWVVSGDGQQMTLTTTGTLIKANTSPRSWCLESSSGLTHLYRPAPVIAALTPVPEASRTATEMMPLRCMNFRIPLTVSSRDGSALPHLEASRAA